MVGKNTRTQSNLEKKTKIQNNKQRQNKQEKTNILRSISEFDIRKLPGTH